MQTKVMSCVAFEYVAISRFALTTGRYELILPGLSYSTVVLYITVLYISIQKQLLVKKGKAQKVQFPKQLKGWY